MRYKILKLVCILILLNISLNAQPLNRWKNLKIDFGVGNSTYQNIKSKQYMVFLNLPRMNASYKNLSLNTDLNIEFIREENKGTYVLGIVPLLRYDVELLNQKLFVIGGTGLNFINNHKIGPRNTGSHFIFSDMLSIGARFFEGGYYAVEISYLFRHISNAGLYKRNQGFNSQYLMLSFII